ncbi:MAG: chromosome segregation protein ScpA, partial [Erysipelotrichaceae bacterium]|nr:chromosome segregation protein ScpA [Erysipelotrichaceae bacterium]
MNEFTVTIDKFDGPLDLMLHLIKEKKLDLLDLDMSVLCDQYMAYLNSMQQLHL